VIVPLLHRIGEQWREGNLGVAHEHVASAMVRTFLGQMRQPVALADGGPALVVATPPRQLHELGALLVAIEADSSGFRVLYLGPDAPVEDIAHAALQTGARAVALSLVYPPDDPRLPGEIERLGRLLPAGTTLLVGGAAASAYREAIARSRAVLVGYLAELRPRLDALRRGAPGRGAR
jgi:methylmalonyl-CoA mutase cobalamin-binding subunit